MDVRLLLLCGVLIPLILAESPVPGMGMSSVLGRAIDIVKPQLQSQQFLPNPIVPMRPPAGATTDDFWISSWTNNKYIIPAGAYVANEPRTSITTKNEILSNYNDVIQYQKQSFSFRISLPGLFSFGFSDVTDSLMKELNSGNYSITAITRQFVLFSGGIWPVNESYVDAGFTKAVKALPESYDQSTYFAFVKKWGTHVLTNTDFGGEWTYYTKVDNNVYSKYSYEYVSMQIDLAVTIKDVTVGFKYNHERNTSKLDETVQSQIKIIETRTGGGSGSFDTWWNQIQNVPYYVNPVWAPLSEFVFDANKKNLVLRAIQEYTNTPPTFSDAQPVEEEPLISVV